MLCNWSTLNIALYYYYFYYYLLYFIIFVVFIDYCPGVTKIAKKAKIWLWRWTPGFFVSKQEEVAQNLDHIHVHQHYSCFINRDEIVFLQDSRKVSCRKPLTLTLWSLGVNHNSIFPCEPVQFSYKQTYNYAVYVDCFPITSCWQ